MKQLVLKLKSREEVAAIVWYISQRKQGTDERANRLAKIINKNYPPYLYYYKQNFTNLTITLVKMTNEEQSDYRKREEKRLITFASIDAKECGYTTLGTDWDGPKTKHNYPILLEAEQEYLEELDKLQKRIRKKYEPKLWAANDDAELSMEEAEDIESKITRNEKCGHLYYT